jgi:hypothetical protein
MTPNAEIKKIAEDVLRTQLASSKILDCRVDAEEDFDGAEIVRVTAVSEIPVDDAWKRLAANTAIRDALLERGDNRYVFLDIEVSCDRPDDEDGDETDLRQTL